MPDEFIINIAEIIAPMFLRVVVWDSRATSHNDCTAPILPKQQSPASTSSEPVSSSQRLTSAEAEESVKFDELFPTATKMDRTGKNAPQRVDGNGKSGFCFLRGLPFPTQKFR